MRNRVPAPNATHERLSAALRAQAGLAAQGGGRRSRPGMPASALLGMSLLLGAVAGGLAGVISAW